MTRKILACTVSAAALSFGLATAHAAATVTINGGGATLPAPTYFKEFDKYTMAHPTVLFSYAGVGSGSGQNAFLNNNIAYFNNPSIAYGTQVGSTVYFAASDAFLSSAQVMAYNSGLATSDGPLVQIPMLGVPVTVAYHNSTISSLTLNDDQLCEVFSGKINDWSGLGLPAGTIHVVYRSDGSGTSFLFSQHLNAVCTASNSNFPVLPVPISSHFTDDFNSSYPVPANFTGASGSSGVSQALLATDQSIGYLSPDYTSIAPGSSSTTSLLVASIVNGTNHVAYAPTVNNTSLGLLNPGPTSTNPTPPANATDAADPIKWIPAVPTTNKGYSIVGYTTWELSQCYVSKPIAADLVSFLKLHYYNAAYKAIINNNGFVALSQTKATGFPTAITKDLIGNASGYNLNIENAAACAGKGR